MTPALLALAAAALLVCVRADASLDIVNQIVQNYGQDGTYNSLKGSRSLSPSNYHGKAQYTQNDSDETLSVFPDRQKVIIKEDNTYDIENRSKLHRNNVRASRWGRAHFYEKQLDNMTHVANDRHGKAFPSGKKTELPSACLYDGRWHSDGAVVSTREDCLRCVCAGGALSCRRRACAALPDPLPPRCHVRHRRGSCCPELHCPDGVQLMEHGASARFDSGDMSDAEVTPATAKNACVEGGSVFAAGSALGSRVACEQCFCMRGARRCVRPSCLPPPPRCVPRPAPGACCPQRYYCDAAHDKPNQHHNKYDCEVDGAVVAEGSPVVARDNCSACFCLRGAVRCQALGCAPALAGCRPLRARGDCCAHQYVCDHDDPESQSHVIAAPASSPASPKYDERTLYSSKSGKLESTTKKILTSLYTLKHSSFASATKNHLITTTKVKRKTDEPPLNASVKPEQNTNTISHNITTTEKPMNAAKLIAMPEFTQSVDPDDSPEKTTEQPEGTVKIVINGTINCTAELSSTSLPLSIINDTDKQLEVLPRVPIVNVEAQTYSPNDIITDRNVNGGFDEEDTFTINVTSSLMTNTSHSTKRPGMTAPKIPMDLAEALNSSKKKKGEYDYDYTEPTLPPSLPNLKIIPFVAADAVVDDEPTKETLTYPILEREDKFPVYYPSAASDTKETQFPVRREDTYQPTQYPVFVLGKVEPSYPSISHEVDVPRDRYPERNDPEVQKYTVSASLGNSDVKTVTQASPTSTTFAMEKPAVNLFSPPVETEGGFLPKGSGIIDEYFGVYPSTPSGPAVPHLTTSMQLDIVKDIPGECSVEQQRVASGQSIVLGCRLCACAWGQLACARRPCAPPAPACRRLPLTNNSQDLCCGDIECHAETNITSAETSTAANVSASTNATVTNENKQNGTNVEKPNTTPEPSAAPRINTTDTANTKANDTEKVTVNDGTAPPQVKSEPVQKTSTTAVPPSTSTKPKLTTTTTTPAPISQVDESSLEEDDDDDDDDGGFSFGSVLKLLLSDSYETTTAPSKKPSTRPPTRLPSTPPVRNPSTSAPLASRPEEEQTFFKPLPPRPYNIPKIQPNTVNRIDHLVLGEATAIKRTTPRPITNKTSPPSTSRPTPQTYERPTPQAYDTTERSPVMQEESVLFTPIATGGPRPPSLGGLPSVGSGLLKLAGCNIYGRMYRVGRIITELSTPCSECWCTELGVQCKPLNC